MGDVLARLQSALGDGYRSEKELGGGGMSRVFLAQERELERQVVVKVLPPEMAAGLNAERFRREIQLAASLQHPHIVPLLAAGHADDLVYYTMPLIEGESLRAKLAREGELPINETTRILCDVADAPTALYGSHAPACAGRAGDGGAGASDEAAGHGAGGARGAGDAVSREVAGRPLADRRGAAPAARGDGHAERGPHTHGGGLCRA